MEQYRKDIKNEVNINDVESIRSSLNKFRDMIISEEAFRESMYIYNNVEFIDISQGEQRRLQAIEAPNQEIINELKKLTTGGCYPFENKIEFGDEHYISEAILFNYACEYEELKEDVIEAANAIVSYSRKHNDSSDMWIDDYTIFGIDILYTVARKYPEYTYLMGSYIIPYWDTEHADYALTYLPALFEKSGVTRELIKAYVYCDNYEMRSNFFDFEEYYWDNEDEPRFLEVYFKENPEEYEFFKEALKDRFKEQPFMLYTNDSREAVDNPVLEFYKTMVNIGDEEDEEEEILGKFFINDTLENEAGDLKIKIEKELGFSIVPEVKEEDDDDDIDDIDPTEELEEFFKEGFDNGNKIWKYIMEDECHNVLDEIKPVDIKKLCNEKDLKYKIKLEYYIGKMDTVIGNFEYIIRNFVYDYLDEEENNGLKLTVKVNGKDLSGRAVILRTFDVFHRLFNKKPFDDYFVNEVVTSWNLVSLEEFTKRYGGDIKASLKATINKFFWSDKISGMELEKIYGVLQQDRGIFAEMGLPTKNRNMLAISAYILKQDFEKNYSDELTESLFNFIDKNYFDILSKSMDRYGKLSKEELEEVMTYFKGIEPPKPSKEIMMKLMKVGPKGLTPQELESIKPTGKVIEKETAIQILRDKLHSEDEYMITKEQPYYSILFYKDGLQSLLLTAYMLGNQVPVKISRGLARVLEVFGTLAPLKVINQLCYYHTDIFGKEFRDKIMGEVDFYENLKRCKISGEGIWGWRINRAQGNDNLEEAYDYQLEMFASKDEDDEGKGFFEAGFNKKYRKEIKESMKYIKQSKRLRFYYDAYNKHPEYGFEEGNQMYYDILGNMIEESVIFLNKSILKKFSNKEVNFKGCFSKVKDMKNLLNNIIMDDGVDIKYCDEQQPYLYLQKQGEGYRILKGAQYVTKIIEESKEQYSKYHTNNTELLILNEQVSDDKINKYIITYNDADRKNDVRNKAISYVKGKVAFDDIKAIIKEETESLDNGYQCGITEGIWMVDEDIRDRTIKMLMEASAEGFGLAMYDYEGEHEQFIEYIKPLNPPIENYVEFILQSELEDALVELQKERDIIPIIKKQKVEYRINAVSYFGDSEELKHLVKLFINDRSRQVRDMVNEYS